MKNRISYIGAILALTTVFIFGSAVLQVRAADCPRVGDAAPEFTIETLDGKTVSLSDYRGKVVFLNFWASWCPPCKAEMPSIESLKDKMAGCDFVILAVSVDSGNQEKIVSKVQNYIDDNGFTFEVLIDNEQTLARDYGVTSVPTTFILDESGEVVEVSRGAEYWDDDARLVQFRDLSPTCGGELSDKEK
ncbi:MAG: TlpA family protein disulfide reductase [Deltaproteobacteria bacterium]|nr:TlpA family protein disulfide reductase [Candidatus Zymogenaceae bacterium]